MPPSKGPKQAAEPKVSASQRALDKFMATAEKTYGSGKFELGVEPSPYAVISTGSIRLDQALVVGGYVKGRTVEIWGPEGVGKSTLVMIAIAELHRTDPEANAYWIDMEHRHDKKLMRAYGIDLKRIVIVKPGNAEEVADMVKDACRSGLFGIVCVDSIGAMIPEIEKTKMSDEAVVANQAKIVTRMVKIAAVLCDETDTVLIMINQVRANIVKFGNPLTTGGGFALKHGTTMKLYLRPTSEGVLSVGTGENKQRVGHLITVMVERNSVALAYKKAEIAILYAPTVEYGPMGIDWAMEAADIGIEEGIIKQNGGWYTNTINDEQVQGKPAVVASLRANRELALQVRSAALELLAADVVLDGGAEAVAADMDEIGITS